MYSSQFLVWDYEDNIISKHQIHKNNHVEYNSICRSIDFHPIHDLISVTYDNSVNFFTVDES